MGLKRLDHFAVFMENHARYIECGAAGERAGLYYTNVNSYLTAGELAYIVNNSLSQVLITSQAKREVALAALARLPRASKLCLIVDGPGDGRARAQSRRGDGAFPATPIADECLGVGDAVFLGDDGPSEGRSAALLPERPPITVAPLLRASCQRSGVSARA